MKGHVYKRGKNWSYLFDIDPDPLTGKRRQVERERVQDRARGVEGLPGRYGRVREGTLPSVPLAARWRRRWMSG